MLEEFKAAMKTQFEMIDLCLMKYFLRIEVVQSSRGIFVYQKKYARDILKIFKMDKCKPIENPIVLGITLSKQDGGSTIDSTLY
jgi:hypothetical protein